MCAFIRHINENVCPPGLKIETKSFSFILLYICIYITAYCQLYSDSQKVHVD